jgi:hypothetical protein
MQRFFSAAPQSRDLLSARKQEGPRISSAPRRKRGMQRSIRGTRLAGAMGFD